MWRRTYFLLALIRLYFALSPSYLHPDEHFQGPEVIAGYIYGYPTTKTWEFTSSHPVRSIFPLLPTYGLPMLLLRWLWEGSGNGLVSPSVVFWTLRVVMFAISFASEDWAIHELIDNPRHRRIAMLLVASSYVTWTWQVHTFSNSLETVLVLWSLVMIHRLLNHRAGVGTASSLAFVLVFGTFNRITFPAFVFAPCLQLIPLFLQRKLTLLIFILVAILTVASAVLIDTSFYCEGHLTFTKLFKDPIVTPWNSLVYNAKPSNLHLHGQHPFYQHVLINLPQLLGPASRYTWSNQNNFLDFINLEFLLKSM